MNEHETLPHVGELVVATVERVAGYGAYVALDEYNGAEGLVHISEVSSRWVKNIRNHLREGQKTVLKVLRVDPVKRHINLSLRRITERQKRERMLQWKHDQRGRRLFELAAKQLGVDRDDAMEKVGRRIEAQFGSLYAGLEGTAMHGKEVLAKADIPSDWVEMLSTIAKSRIRIPLKKVKGDLVLTSHRPDGVEVVKAALTKAKHIEAENADVNIYVVGAPRYRIEVSAYSYKEAEKLLADAVEAIVATIEAAGGEGTFTRK